MPLKIRARVSNGLKQQRNTASKRIRREPFKAVGLDLSSVCFAHGMFYVAVSRLGSSAKLSILAPNNRTRNVVYPEALL